MKIIEPYIEVENYNGKKIMKNIEKACRNCYQSADKITKDSYKVLLKNCINREHLSVLEHEKITINMKVDTGVVKDITRHRTGTAFSIESTRYCGYNKDKFGGELTFIKPCNIEENSDLYAFWKNSMERIEMNYIHMANHGATPDQMRMILPHSTAAMVFMSCNIREWRHIFELRCSKMAHPSVQQVMIPLLLKFKEDMPEIFGDIKYNIDFPKEKYANIKVI